MRNLLSFLAGSVSLRSTQFYLHAGPGNLTRFEDYLTYPSRVRDTHRNEFSVFVKDDWKATAESHAQSRSALGLVWIDLRCLRNDAAADRRSGSDLRSIGPRLGRILESRRPRRPDRVRICGQEFARTRTRPISRTTGTISARRWDSPGRFPGSAPAKTTVEGGYQITFNGLPSFNSLTQTQVTPGSTLAGTLHGTAARIRTWI